MKNGIRMRFGEIDTLRDVHKKKRNMFMKDYIFTEVESTSWGKIFITLMSGLYPRKIQTKNRSRFKFVMHVGSETRVV